MMIGRLMFALVGGTCLAILMNCSSVAIIYKDPEFVPYVQEFIRISRMADKRIETRVNNVSIVFGKVEDQNFAEYKYFDNRITVSEQAWKSLPSDAVREELIFHELGHSSLWLGHEQNTIMQEMGMLGEWYYTTHYSDLLNIHFGCEIKKCINEKYNFDKYSQNKGKRVTKAEILNNTHAVVRFTATWCPPCKALAPVFDEVAADHPDVKTYVIDVDENQDLARDLNVRGIPTCMAIRNNAQDLTLVGNQPKPELEKLFK